MQATATLATTTFASAVAMNDNQVLLSSTSGIVPGVRLFCNGELLGIIGLTGIGNAATVLRGIGGTATRRHATNDTVYIGRGDQFFLMDPVGTPPLVTSVNPHINIANGNIWVIQGDDTGGNTGMRSWQKVTIAQSIGPLGVRVNTTTTPS